MKKQFLSTSALLLMVIMGVSCAKSDVAPQGGESQSSQIAFRASTGKTRSNDNAIAQLIASTGFNVIGVDRNNAYVGGFAAPAADNVTYFYDNVVSPRAWAWKNVTAGASKVWPSDQAIYPLQFFAAFPIDANITKDATTVTPTVVTNVTPSTTFVFNTFYQGIPNAITPANVSVDMLAAHSDVAGKPVSGFADLTFKHIMSNIAFEILVPTGVTVDIQSIKIANMNMSGRTYDYKTKAWSAEPVAYAAADHAHFAHFNATTTAPAIALQTVDVNQGEVNGFAATNGYNTLKLMPQTKTVAWGLGKDDGTDPDSFRKDAKAWVTAHPTVNAAAITAWHNAETTANGMVDSKGWEGARIELIYRLIDNTGKVVVGRKNAKDQSGLDRFVRVGYVLDLSTIDTKNDTKMMGLHPGYRYTFQIPLGTAEASNGILLDPDFKDADGNTTNEPVSNPANVNPGDPLSKQGGVIHFNVSVKDWDIWTGTIN